MPEAEFCIYSDKKITITTINSNSSYSLYHYIYKIFLG